MDYWLNIYSIFMIHVNIKKPCSDYGLDSLFLLSFFDDLFTDDSHDTGPDEPDSPTVLLDKKTRRRFLDLGLVSNILDNAWTLWDTIYFVKRLGVQIIYSPPRHSRCSFYSLKFILSFFYFSHEKIVFWENSFRNCLHIVEFSDARGLNFKNAVDIQFQRALNDPSQRIWVLYIETIGNFQNVCCQWLCCSPVLPEVYGRHWHHLWLSSRFAYWVDTLTW